MAKMHQVQLDENNQKVINQISLPEGAEVVPSDAKALAPGEASAGTDDKYARGDHRHPAQVISKGEVTEGETGDVTVTTVGLESKINIQFPKQKDGEVYAAHSDSEEASEELKELMPDGGIIIEREPDAKPVLKQIVGGQLVATELSGGIQATYTADSDETDSIIDEVEEGALIVEGDGPIVVETDARVSAKARNIITKEDDGIYVYGRKVASASITFYVRTSGNDDNDGLTEATAVATIERAVICAAQYDYDSRNCVINIGEGTFAKPSASISGAYFRNCNSLRIVGVGGKKTIISSPTASNFLLTGFQFPIGVNVENIHFINVCLYFERVLTAYAANCSFERTVVGDCLAAFSYTRLHISGSVEFKGTVNTCFVASQFSEITTANKLPVKYDNVTCQYSNVFARYLSIVSVYDCEWDGVPTGKRYVGYITGTVFVNNKGADWIPGTADGTIVDNSSLS